MKNNSLNCIFLTAAFFDLSQAAIRVFGYFMTCMKPKNDLIIFNRKKCLEYTKYKTDKAVYKGLAELVKAEIIAEDQPIIFGLLIL